MKELKAKHHHKDAFNSTAQRQGEQLKIFEEAL